MFVKRWLQRCEYELKIPGSGGTGQNVKQRFQNDLQLEIDAVKRLNAGIHTCVAAKDNGSRELLEKILVEEEEHIDHLEAQLTLSKRSGSRTTSPSN